MNPPEPWTVVAVDDEPPALDVIENLISQSQRFAVEALFSDPFDAAREIPDIRPDLLFIDVQMPGMDGFSLLETIGPEAARIIVFITAYDDHAVRAFEVNALDYLLKPFTEERFLETLNRADQRLRADTGDVQALRTLLDNMLPRRDAGSYVQRFTIPTRAGHTVISVEDIYCVRADRNYVILSSSGGEGVLRSSMTDLEKQLDPKEFFRVHRSAIVRLDAVSRIRATSAGLPTIVLSNGDEVPLSSSKKEELLRRLSGR